MDQGPFQQLEKQLQSLRHICAFFTAGQKALECKAFFNSKNGALEDVAILELRKFREHKAGSEQGLTASSGQVESETFIPTSGWSLPLAAPSFQ